MQVQPCFKVELQYDAEFRTACGRIAHCHGVDCLLTLPRLKASVFAGWIYDESELSRTDIGGVSSFRQPIDYDSRAAVSHFCWSAPAASAYVMNSGTHRMTESAIC